MSVNRHATAVTSAPRSTVRRVGGLLRALVDSLIRRRRVHAIGAAAGAFALFVIVSIAPPAPRSDAQALEQYITDHAQGVTVSPTVTGALRDDRGEYTASPGIQTLKAEGTNYAWAKMVMLFGGWPMSDGNITVFTRWMRQENGADDWWNRNNPLNNGWGTQGGTFMSGYVDLVDAARNAAEAIKTNPGYAGILDGFSNARPTETIESGIWNSSWASGHYAYGGHWHYTPVDVVKAPASAWG